MNDCKKRLANLGMTCIGLKKAYKMISHFWILSLELVRVSENIVQFNTKSMKNWNTGLTLCGDYLAKVDIRSGIFQGGKLLSLLFAIIIALLTHRY